MAKVNIGKIWDLIALSSGQLMKVFLCISLFNGVEASENRRPERLKLVDFENRLLLRESDSSADLKVIKSGLLPLTEVSAFASAPGSDPTKNGFLAIGDQDPTVWRTNKIDLNDSPRFPSSLETLTDLLKPMGFSLSECIENSSNFCKKTREGLSAQWEGADLDQNQQLWLLQESTESVHIFDSSVTQRHTTINIERPNLENLGSPLPRPFKDKENSIYEGIHVLSPQQFLLAKQAGPSALVLFEIKDSPAKENRLPRIRKAGATKSWLLPPPYQNCSLSELAYFEDDYFLLSPSCHVILKAQLTSNLGQLSITEVLSYPSHLEHAEALLVLGHHKFLMGTDTKEGDQDNVYLLKDSSALEATHR